MDNRRIRARHLQFLAPRQIALLLQHGHELDRRGLVGEYLELAYPPPGPFLQAVIEAGASIDDELSTVQRRIFVSSGGGVYFPKRSSILHIIVLWRPLTPLIQLLFARGADIGARDAVGVTPLQLALRSDNLTALRKLVRLGAKDLEEVEMDRSGIYKLAKGNLLESMSVGWPLAKRAAKRHGLEITLPKHKHRDGRCGLYCKTWCDMLQAANPVLFQRYDQEVWAAYNCNEETAR